MGHVWIASRYSGLPEQLIHTFKFERAQAAALEIAYLMHQALPHLRPGTVIVPVPTVTSHIRQRGYDHTDLLARALSRESKHAYDPALRRLGQSRQVGAVRVQRLAQLRGAFRAAKPVAGKNILLVDDVVTTGATLEEAAWVLHRAGAKRINGLVFAQK
jgi:ComF family protein